MQTPDGFEATLFARSPEANYPVAVACEPGGAVYIAIDEQGSLGTTPDGGRIVRCLDHDDDGVADEFTVFARVDHPRGLCYRDGSVWVMHPPTPSVFHDDDRDGVSDRHEVLVTGLTTSLIDERGGDHTTNCVRMGIDGWLYVGVGDYGIQQATGADGRTISLRGGGIVRVRPDGTELEIYCTGLRNPFDIAIDPLLNLFTRDNTNDGAGWDVRVSHLFQTAEYGYPRLVANFTEETMRAGAFGGEGDRRAVRHRAELARSRTGTPSSPEIGAAAKSIPPRSRRQERRSICSRKSSSPSPARPAWTSMRAAGCSSPVGGAVKHPSTSARTSGSSPA